MWMLSQSVNYAVVAEGSAEWRQWVTLKRNHLQDFGKVLEEVAWRLSFSQARALPGLSCLVALTTRVFPARLWCPGSLRWFALLQVALSDGAQQRMLSVVWVTNPKGIYSCVWSWSRRESLLRALKMLKIGRTGAAANALAVGSFGFWVIYSWLPWILECSKKAPGCSVSLSNRPKMQSKKADCMFTMKTPQVPSYVIAGCEPMWLFPHNYCGLLSLPSISSLWSPKPHSWCSY